MHRSELIVAPDHLCCSAMAPEHTLSAPPSLGDLAQDQPVALFLDFDGTLVDIAPTPDSIMVPQGLAASLRCLSENLSGRLALVSGRSVADLRRHLGHIAIACAGSHGVERFNADGTPTGPGVEPVPTEVTTALRTFALARDGLAYEDKSYGAALHFRARPELGEEAIAHATQVANDAGMSLKHGSCVVEIVGKDAAKSAAVSAFMAAEPFVGARPVFVGDDLTDEDGFRAASELGGFGIVVGERVETRARYRIDGPQGVRTWLGI